MYGRTTALVYKFYLASFDVVVYTLHTVYLYSRYLYCIYVRTYINNIQNETISLPIPIPTNIYMHFYFFIKAFALVNIILCTNQIFSLFIAGFLLCQQQVLSVLCL